MTLKNAPIDAHSHDDLDQHQRDETFMRKAIELAKQGQAHNEVPIGAVIVAKSGKVIAKATNLRETHNTTLGHAELVAIHRACKKLGSWRLLDCTLYVTLEPCFMCAGALVQSRISRVVYGAPDPKGGALHSLAQLGTDTRLNHQFEITAGVLEGECGLLLKNFFKQKRRSSKK